MKWQPFHHPDISLPVVRRKAGNELILLLSGATELIASAGRSAIYAGCYPNRRAFHASVERLRQQGLIAVSKNDGSLPELKLTSAAIKGLPPHYTPETFWDRRWNKWWYVLMFDVPEKNRAYRDTLRAFLKKMRCGCLQKSVWVTPTDIRADYDDLNRAASVDSVAFLFESRTVLGFGDQSVVREAWNFDRLNQLHELYIKFAQENLLRLKNGPATDEDILALLRMNHLAYEQAMVADPLLPRILHPEGYQGERVYQMHSTLCRMAAERVRI